MKTTLFVALSLFFSNLSLSYGRNYDVKQLTFLNIDSSINPATLNYLQSNIQKHNNKNNELFIIKLNTPGGLVSTTKEIMTLIGDSDSPVAVWITPEGASATSAGAIIASSAHLLYMSAGTNIGAATPIEMSGDIKQTDARSKAINDLVALVKSLSIQRGRNPKSFEQMISKAQSLDSKAALQNNTIDGIANSQKELLLAFQGKQIKVKGQTLTLNINTSTPIQTIEMDPGQKLLNIFSHPSTAYILFIIGAALLYFELQAPGGFIAGAIGAVALILAGIGFSVLPLNLGAIGLIIISFILFILEAYVTSYGIISLAGVAALSIGSLFLYRTSDSYLSVEKSLVFSASAAIGVYVLLLGYFILRTTKHTKFFNHENQSADVMSFLEQKEDSFLYQVKIAGEIWNAISQKPLEIGSKVQVFEQENNSLVLIVK